MSKTNGRPKVDASEERKPWTTPLEARFAEAEPNLSSNRQRLIREILDHPEDTYFLSSRALAKRYDLDPTTIVRTIQALGYKRYGEFAGRLAIAFCGQDYSLCLDEISGARKAQRRGSHRTHAGNGYS